MKKNVNKKEFLLQLKAITIAVIIIFALSLLVGCGTYNNQPKIQVTHVLAVTEQGDTLRLPISMIKPNVYYNVISYPNRYYGNWYNSYYQPGYHNNRPIYAPSSGSGSSNNNNNSNNNKPASKPKPIPNMPVSQGGKVKDPGRGN